MKSGLLTFKGAKLSRFYDIDLKYCTFIHRQVSLHSYSSKFEKLLITLGKAFYDYFLQFSRTSKSENKDSDLILNPRLFGENQSVLPSQLYS